MCCFFLLVETPPAEWNNMFAIKKIFLLRRKYLIIENSMFGYVALCIHFHWNRMRHSNARNRLQIQSNAIDRYSQNIKIDSKILENHHNFMRPSEVFANFGSFLLFDMLTFLNRMTFNAYVCMYATCLRLCLCDWSQHKFGFTCLSACLLKGYIYTFATQTNLVKNRKWNLKERTNCKKRSPPHTHAHTYTSILDIIQTTTTTTTLKIHTHSLSWISVNDTSSLLCVYVHS